MPGNVEVNTLYSASQLLAAVAAVERTALATTAGSAKDQEAARKAAAETVRKWTDVMTGMANGTLSVGSRQPIRDTPVWVTPEVAQGGFATGQSAAGGELQPHEIALAESAGLEASRKALAAYYLTDAGLKYLTNMLETGEYTISLPEEAALLIAAWLLANKDVGAAVALLGTITPSMEHLRFAPAPGPPGSVPPVATADACASSIIDTLPLHRFTAQQTLKSLENVRSKLQMQQNIEAVTIWAPFYDELLSLWLEALTEDGSLPDKPMSKDWCSRGALLVARYAVLEPAHPLSKKHKAPGSNNKVLLTAMARAVTQCGLLAPGTSRQVASRISAMLQKRGRPGGAHMQELRQRQAACVRLPQHKHLAAILLRRINSSDLRLDQGFPKDALQNILQAVTVPEASAAAAEGHANVLAGSEIPQAVSRRVDRALQAPLQELIDSGVVPSGEALASLVPKIASAASAAQYSDPQLARVMSGLATAFAARRSLLLLYLQSQVKIHELPWHSAVSKYADPSKATGVTREALRRIAETAVLAFPEVVLPNPLVKQLAYLNRIVSQGATQTTNGDSTPEAMETDDDEEYYELYDVDEDGDNHGDNPTNVIGAATTTDSLVLLEELAADIFMGAFSVKFALAARQAADMLRGSPYERYYDLDYAALLQSIPEPRAGQYGSTEFYSVCKDYAQKGCEFSSGRYMNVAENGVVIEQAQIITTHNLAMLVGVAEIRAEAAGGWGAVATRCAKTVIRLTEQAQGRGRYQDKMRSAKKAAFAWRQMVFFLSMEKDDSKTVIALNVLNQAKSKGVKSALAPHLERLRAALEQNDATWKSNVVQEKYIGPLVGWTLKRHPLLEPKPNLNPAILRN